ncbi:MAG: helix-turn-helix domain-containing protein [Clostridia bacterium]|nr:helix-turn-helix domain-containing protein [Clostridia bacterium]MDE6757802.1 helix-turn-helix domain-containing protein [Clostridia bacterium]MDE7079434.1 helix-turn-helix domain-containing protein [Clostridia bacterium]
MNIFGTRVKKELKNQGKKQVDLCNYLNVKKSTLSEWLNGNNEPSMKYIVEIAIFLDVSTDYLLGIENYD